jgi:hypothetical protein
VCVYNYFTTDKILLQILKKTHDVLDYIKHNNQSNLEDSRLKFKVNEYYLQKFNIYILVFFSHKKKK